jgi:hypothetical protein
VTTRFVKKEAPVTAAGAEKGEEAEDDAEEEQEELDFEGETLWIGLKSGKIFRQTEEAGDLLIGIAGKGRFKDVKKPE